LDLGVASADLGKFFFFFFSLSGLQLEEITGLGAMRRRVAFWRNTREKRGERDYDNKTTTRCSMCITVV
jgi:hypothetical protein